MPWRATFHNNGLVSPLLANIYLDKLDRFVGETLIPEYTRGTKRKALRAYEILRQRSRRQRVKGSYERAEALRKEAQQGPTKDPNDPGFRRLKYERYADDFLLSFAGPKTEAEEIKVKLGEFLRTTLNLTMAEEKTLVTHAITGRARFLGYEIGIMRSQTKFDDKRRRSVNGLIRLDIPEDVIRRKRQRFLRGDRIIHRPELLNDSEFDIIYRYQWEYRGLVEYPTFKGYGFT